MPISLTAGTRSTSTPSTFDLTALTDRIAKLEAAISGSTGDEILQLDRSLADADLIKPWKLAHEVIKDYTAWTITFRDWKRVDKDSVELVFEKENVEMFPATHANAIEVAPGQFKTPIRGGGEITYKTTRASGDSDFIKFPQGSYSSWSWHFVDADKNRVGTYGSNDIILQQSFTGQSQPLSPPFPIGVKFVRYTLKRAAGGITIYDAPVE
jgi:hypothetical protein